MSQSRRDFIVAAGAVTFVCVAAVRDLDFHLLAAPPALGFSFGLVEVALYGFEDGSLAVQPRVVAKTRLIAETEVHGFSHVTGGGLAANLARVLPVVPRAHLVTRGPVSATPRVRRRETRRARAGPRSGSRGSARSARDCRRVASRAPPPAVSQ